MFKAFLITYELRNTSVTNYSSLFDEIKKSYKWWHYLPSAWIILTNEDITSVRAKLIPLIYKNDNLLIIEIRKTSDGWLPADAWKWINENVPV